MESKLITIIGITGTQGSSVANHFLKRADWRIRGTTRDTSSAKAQAWTAKGIEMVRADANDIASLECAFLGANAIFAVTDYAATYHNVISSPKLQKQAKEANRSTAEYAGDLELVQGINIATAASEPLVLRTLERFIFSSLPSIRKFSDGKYAQAPETDAKAAIESHIRQNYHALTQRLSTVSLSMFLENWKSVAAMSPHKEPDGSYTFLDLDWPGPYREYPYMIASRDTGAFVSALIVEHPPGTDVSGISVWISIVEYARLWGKVMGLKTNVKYLGLEEWASYVPDEIRAPMKDMFRFYVEYGFPGSHPNVKKPEELGIRTTSLETWIREEDWTSVTS